MTDTTPSRARPSPCVALTHVRAWANAKFFESMDWYLHRRLGARKQALFADLPRLVVELGSGAGASMRYLAPGSRLVAIEPNPHAHDALRRNAARYGIDLEIRGERAESTGLAKRERRRGDLHARAVHGGGPQQLRSRKCAASCVLEDVSCSSSTLGPVRVRSEQLQRLLRRPWRYVFDGCCLDRDTAATIAATGFADVRIEHYRFGGVFVPVWPQISGVAVA